MTFSYMVHYIYVCFATDVHQICNILIGYVEMVLPSLEPFLPMFIFRSDSGYIHACSFHIPDDVDIFPQRTQFVNHNQKSSLELTQ